MSTPAKATRAPKLGRAYLVRKGLTTDQLHDFNSALIGALSPYVSEEDWDNALESALRCVRVEVERA